jgi:UDP-glucose 4-epimerase
MNLLIVGGAGYIGSHMVKHLLAAGHGVVVADNFATGHRDAVVGGELVELDIADAAALQALFAAQHFDAVLHFASFIQVGESVTEPGMSFPRNFVFQESR